MPGRALSSRPSRSPHRSWSAPLAPLSRPGWVVFTVTTAPSFLVGGRSAEPRASKPPRACHQGVALIEKETITCTCYCSGWWVFRSF